MGPESQTSQIARFSLHFFCILQADLSLSHTGTRPQWPFFSVFVVMVNERWCPPLYWPRVLGTPASPPPPTTLTGRQSLVSAGGWLTLVRLCKDSLLDKLGVLNQRLTLEQPGVAGRAPPTPLSLSLPASIRWQPPSLPLCTDQEQPREKQLYSVKVLGCENGFWRANKKQRGMGLCFNQQLCSDECV